MSNTHWKSFSEMPEYHQDMMIQGFQEQYYSKYTVEDIHRAFTATNPPVTFKGGCYDVWEAHRLNFEEELVKGENKPAALTETPSLPVEPGGEFDPEIFWNNHKQTFGGVNAGEYIDREDFEKALHIQALGLKQPQQPQALPVEEVPEDIYEAKGAIESLDLENDRLRKELSSLREQLAFERQRWEEMNEKYGQQGERVAAKDDALLKIAQACQDSKDDPNVSGILKIAQEALK